MKEFVKVPDDGEITVVIPTRDRCSFLLRALRSVLAQERVDLRVVVVDDGGRDGTSDAVRELGDERVTVVQHPRSLGVARARNAGLARVGSPWVAFLDDDDFFAPFKLRVQLDALRGTPEAGWSYVGAVFVDGRVRVRLWSTAPKVEPLAQALLARNIVPGGGSGVVAKTALARSIGGFDEGIASAEDWDFYIRLALASPAVAVNLPLLAYTVHAGSRSFNSAELDRAFRYITRKFADERDARGVALDDAWWTMFIAAVTWRGGDRRQGLALYVRCLRARPSARLLALILTQTAPGWLRELKPIVSKARVPAAWKGEAGWLRDREWSVSVAD